LPILLVPMGALYVAAARLWFASPAVKLALRLALAALAVAPPAVLLGGTLPVLVKALALASPTAPVAVARLYAVNALGAVGGTLAGGFVLQPLLGAWSPLIAAAALNVGAAALALRAGGPQGGRACPPEVMAGAAAPPPTSRPASPPHLRDALALPALALCGFAALGHEILLVRVVGLAFGSSSYAFTMMLAAFIAAVALGGWVAGITPPAFAPAALVTTQLVAAGAFLAVTPLLARLPYWLDLLRASLRAVPFGFHLLHLATAALLLAIIGVPVGCLAVAFPLVGVQMGAGEVGRVDRTGVLGD
jgi:spermidine synthase